MSVKQRVMAIQQALAAKGFSPGNIDGVWGRRTDAAVKAFQARAGLQVDGVVGPKTADALFGHAAPAADPLDDVSLMWFQEARRLLGVREDTTSGSNPVILDWASDAGIPYKNDDIAWCGLFVAHCVGSTLTTEALPGNPLGAQSWLRFGAPCTVRPGAVMVFWREKPTSWKGHVGFYAGEDNVAYHILGGNQSDKVSIARIKKDRLLPNGIRWPATVPLSSGGPVKVAANGVLSRYEG
jgi:uncharacterized protein (TIGR02594 family)